MLCAVAPLGPGETATGPAGSAVARAASGFVACIDTPSCVDGYLWSVYARTPKIDGGRDFAWKDVEAADKAGLSPMEYVIGGMDRDFRITLYRALRTLDLAGFRPGILCGFRDDYRQSITAGRMKAQNDRSFHGGSFRGGYGHGLAADIVSVKGATRDEQAASADRMWHWIDTHEQELGIGRPYLKRDPPHVAPIDGEEYAAHRLWPSAQGAGPKTRIDLPLAAPGGRPHALRTDLANFADVTH